MNESCQAWGKTPSCVANNPGDFFEIALQTNVVFFSPVKEILSPACMRACTLASPQPRGPTQKEGDAVSDRTGD